MNEVQPALFLAVFLIGVVLGIFFFGGLYLTIRRLSITRHPFLLVMGSFMLRLLLTLVGFYWAMDGELWRLVVCLMGFLVARQVIVHKFKTASVSPLVLMHRESVSKGS